MMMKNVSCDYRNFDIVNKLNQKNQRIDKKVNKSKSYSELKKKQ